VKECREQLVTTNPEGQSTMEHTHREYNILQFLAQLMAIMGRVGAIRENKVSKQGSRREEQPQHPGGSAADREEPN